VEWVEVAGKSVDEAKEAALDQLGVAEKDAEVIIVAEPKVGLFGRVRGEARVRARVRPVGPRPKRTRRTKERPDRGRDDRGATGRSGGKNASGRPRDGRQDRERPPGGDRQNGGDRGNGGDRPTSTDPSGELRSTGDAASGTSRSARRRRNRAANRGTAGVNGAGSAQGSAARNGAVRNDDRAAAAGSDDESMTREETGMAEGMTLEEQAEVARDFLQGLLARYGLDAAIETRVLDEETVEIAATGDGLGVLVGPKGATLAALQDVTRTVVQRQCPGKTDRILVDVAGYREKRAAALQRFSQQVSTEVVETGTERALEPMSPADRKVIHDSVKEIDGVASRSEGEDPSRYIVIAPAS
jgi:spoIIIJ-associated protein